MQLVFTEEDLKSLPISADPEIMHGALCFRGTRVPVDAILGNIAAGLSLPEVIEEFPTVKREDAEALIRFINQKFNSLALQPAA
jgi:uncharacterized protein (DUF433 family)